MDATRRTTTTTTTSTNAAYPANSGQAYQAAYPAGFQVAYPGGNSTTVVAKQPTSPWLIALTVLAGLALLGLIIWGIIWTIEDLEKKAAEKKAAQIRLQEQQRLAYQQQQQQQQQGFAGAGNGGQGQHTGLPPGLSQDQVDAAVQQAVANPGTPVVIHAQNANTNNGWQTGGVSMTPSDIGLDGNQQDLAEESQKVRQGMRPSFLQPLGSSYSENMRGGAGGNRPGISLASMRASEGAGRALQIRDGALSKKVSQTVGQWGGRI